MQLVFFGSGTFGAPTLRALLKRHEIALVVTQPDRPAGRRRATTPTPIAELAARQGLRTIKPPRINDPDVLSMIHDVNAEALVVIAYGQKLAPPLLEGRFAINLHGSLLPKYRGAAPVNHAIINGEKVTGLSVITLAERMDAGDILGQIETPIDPHETAGELHDRLAALGPQIVLEVLERFESGRATRERQDESKVTHAPKLTKADGAVDFNQPATRVRNRIHGLTPWPGCRVRLGDQVLRLHRVTVVSEDSQSVPAGALVNGDCVACGVGLIRLLAVHPAGGKMMSFNAFARGRDIREGLHLEPLGEEAKQ